MGRWVGGWVDEMVGVCWGGRGVGKWMVCG